MDLYRDLKGLPRRPRMFLALLPRPRCLDAALRSQTWYSRDVRRCRLRWRALILLLRYGFRAWITTERRAKHSRVAYARTVLATEIHCNVEVRDGITRGAASSLAPRCVLPNVSILLAIQVDVSAEPMQMRFINVRKKASTCAPEACAAVGVDIQDQIHALVQYSVNIP